MKKTAKQIQAKEEAGCNTGICKIPHRAQSHQKGEHQIGDQEFFIFTGLDEFFEHAV